MVDQVVLLKDLLVIINGFAAFDLAAAWDNVGLMVGEPDKPVSGILVALDPTVEVLDEALALGVNTIVTHHPCIFQPIRSVRTDQVGGRFLVHALRNGLAVVGCHTNLDVVAGGVSDILAAQLGLADVRPLSAAPDSGQDGSFVAQNQGFGRIGRLAVPQSAEYFFEQVLKVLSEQVVRVAGPTPAQIELVAVCGGSGSDLAETAYARGADLYVTAEVKHSTARWAESVGFCIVDAGHYSTENLVISALVALLHKEFAARGIDLTIAATAKQVSPFRICIRKA